jgi:hypothetical protein
LSWIFWSHIFIQNYVHVQYSSCTVHI